MDPVDLLAIAVLGFFGWRLAVSFKRSLAEGARAHTARLVRGLRPRHFAPVPFLLTAVIGASWLLLQVPGLTFGWWTAIGGIGNPAFGMTEATAGTPLFDLVPVLFVILLIPALPLLVEREEEIFRLGAEEWSPFKRVWRAVVFGLVHALVGIPIGVALALSIGGGWFTYSYLRGVRRGGTQRAGIDESTRMHLAYNSVIVVLVAAVLVYDFIVIYVL